MEAIKQAIEHATRAGKLRTYVRENGDGLRGLERLADYESAKAAKALAEVMRRDKANGSAGDYGAPVLTRGIGEDHAASEVW